MHGTIDGAKTAVGSSYVRPRMGLWLAVLAAGSMAGGESRSAGSRLASGWVTTCEGSAFERVAPPGRSGPGPERPVFRINDQLVVAVPKENQPAANSLEREPDRCKTPTDVPLANYLIFTISGNWSAGYDPKEVPSVDGIKARDVRPDRVTVRIERVLKKPVTPEEQQALDQIQKKGLEGLYGDTRQVAGLTCAVPRLPDLPWLMCSQSAPGAVGAVRLQYRPLNASFVHIQADYSSDKYGGVRVYWKTVTSDINHWHDIETEIWRSLADWNVLGNPKGDGATLTQPAGEEARAGHPWRAADRNHLEMYGERQESRMPRVSTAGLFGSFFGRQEGARHELLHEPGRYRA